MSGPPRIVFHNPNSKEEMVRALGALCAQSALEKARQVLEEAARGEEASEEAASGHRE